MSFLQYSAVGGAATAVHWGVLALLVQSGGLRADVAAAVGAGCGAVAAYLGNHRFAFAGTAPHMFALPRFLAVAVLSVLLSATTVLLLSTVSGAHYLLAQAIATLLTLCGGYALNKRWAFRRRAA